MANTITISVSPQDLQFLQDNPSISPSKIFRSAMKLERARDEFLEIWDLWDYALKLRDQGDKFILLQREIQRRNERIESLTDVLASKEIAERRIRKAIPRDSGTRQEDTTLTELRRELGELPEILTGSS